MDHENRVVVLIDMDCFYCQVEEKLNPELKGKPIAVVQYNPWKGGGIIAVNYVARSAGVTRHMRGDEAKAKCPDIQLPAVPCRRGKADITKYRDAGKDVAKVLQKFTPLLERASIDEAYLDITAAVQTRLATLSVQTVSCDMMPNTFALGYGGMEEFLSEVHACASDSVDFDYDHAKRLLVGAVIASEIRAAVFEQTGYRCSAGIAHNKVLAKLVCGMHKPDKQTVLPKHSVDALYRTLSVKKVKHLGGKFGDAVCGALGINTMAELQSFSEKELQAKFDEKNGTWLYNIARGTDLEPVQARFNPKSIGCCKQFRGKTALNDLDSLKKWLKDLGDEIEDRLEKDALENNRTPKQMVVSFSVQADGRDAASSRSYNFAPEDDLCGATFTNRALALVLESAGGCKSKNSATNRRLNAPIKFLGISVGKFEDNNENKKTKRINEYFVAGSSRETTRPPKDKMNTKRTNSEDNNYTFNTLSSGAKVELPSHNRKEHCAKENIDVTEVKEATLDGRESFFAKYLNTRDNPDENRTRDLLVGGGVSETEAQPFIAGVSRCATPQCNGVPCGDDSNDTNYSSSTINEEINKSIALFEEDPDDIVRVSSMRQLLNNNSENLQNGEIHDGGEDLKGEPEPTRVSPPVKPAPQLTDAVFCSECGKSISVTKLEEHADYHFALKLREEERKEVRKDRESSAAEGLDGKETHARRKKPEELANKTETATSITNYLIKIDSRVPTSTCAACGLNVAADRFAEHRDFHEAQKLSREWNSRPSHTSGKRKRRTSACPAKGPKMQCRPIDQFFR